MYIIDNCQLCFEDEGLPGGRLNLRPPHGPSLALSFWPEPLAPLGTRLPATLSPSFLLTESGLADPGPVALDVQLSSQEERPFPKAGRLRRANSIVCKAGAINLSVDLFPPSLPSASWACPVALWEPRLLPS